MFLVSLATQDRRAPHCLDLVEQVPAMLLNQNLPQHLAQHADIVAQGPVLFRKLDIAYLVQTLPRWISRMYRMSLFFTPGLPTAGLLPDPHPPSPFGNRSYAGNREIRNPSSPEPW